jgi:hypothetical protein
LHIGILRVESKRERRLRPTFGKWFRFGTEGKKGLIVPANACASLPLRAGSYRGRSTAKDQGNDKENQKNNKQHMSEPGSFTRDAGESQEFCNEGNNNKCDCPP